MLSLIRIEALLPFWPVLAGRPPAERAALARAFVAKAVFNVPTTRPLITLLASGKTLRQLCGWQRASDVPSEATFSRAFAEFANSGLPSRLHAALIQHTYTDRLVGHVSRDSSPIGVNAAIKDHHGGRSVQEHGADKVMCHLMFGVLCITALQVMRLII